MTAPPPKARPPAVLLVGDHVAGRLADGVVAAVHEPHPAADATHARLVLQWLAADVVALDLRAATPHCWSWPRISTTSVPQVAGVLERDVVAVSEVMRLVNSAWFGMRARVDSVVQAVRLLGVDVVQALAVASGGGCRTSPPRRRSRRRC